MMNTSAHQRPHCSISGSTTSCQCMPSEIVSYKQSMERSSEPNKYSNSSMSSRPSSEYCTLWSVTNCVRITANTKVSPNSKKSVQASDRRESVMETTSMRKPPMTYSMRVKRSSRMSLKRRKMRMALIWLPVTAFNTFTSLLCVTAPRTPRASSKTCMATTIRSKTFHFHPGSKKNERPLMQNRMQISIRKMAQKILSTVRKPAGISVHQFEAMYSVSMPMTIAFSRIMLPMT
mmetsp:Transcript_76192/g.202323  ORF Transcript_76192/g.202323 Transcript_76192/m.202323 type:complete len:233 (-) Transcript_76192:846-1544(-)